MYVMLRILNTLGGTVHHKIAMRIWRRMICKSVDTFVAAGELRFNLWWVKWSESVAQKVS